MLAIAGGLGAAILFATSTLCSSRSARMIGPASVLAWVMVVGLIAIAPALVATGPPDLGTGSVALLALGGVGNVLGLLLTYAALRVGKVGIVASIVSTEGAIAAVLAVIAGEALSPGAGVTLALIAAGIVLASRGAEADGAPADRRRAVLLAVAGAAAFGASLYATGRVGADVGAAWAVLPARIVGVVAIAMPLAASSRLDLTRPALPLVVTSGVCEVLGFALFTLGARHGIAVSSVLVSEFGAIAAVAAFVLFRERLARTQVAGVAAIVLGVGALSALQA
jgi:drug/metabolite transporter (DMT)-like permease